MKPTRRDFIKIAAFGILGKGFISIPTEFLSAKSKDYENGIEITKGYIVFNNEAQKSMEALADTIIPGSQKIGIRNLFMDYISKNRGLAVYLDTGYRNLDTIGKQKYKKPYYKLDEVQKKAIIKHVTDRSMTFFNIFKQTIIKLYYSSPQVWKMLSYKGPPQPRGFLNYTDAPKTS